jgi:hypothetical protein
MGSVIFVMRVKNYLFDILVSLRYFFPKTYYGLTRNYGTLDSSE